MIKAVKGTRDILPPSSAAWNQVEAIAREVFRIYNYQEIRTPILEPTELFARGVGQETDIVSKEMYTFEDRDGSSLTLRPEATASVIRAYIEHRLDQKPGLQKLYYIGPMFRRERPQKGRYRQFYQIGAEAIGSESPAVDAEVIEMVVEVLRRAGLSGFELLLNSVGDQNCRPQYVALLKERLRDVASRLCEDCQRRAETNPAARPRLQSSRRPGHHRRAAFHSGPPLRTVRHTFRRGSRILGRSRDKLHDSAADGPRAGLLHAHHVSRSFTALWARKIPCSEAAAMTGWPSRSGRRSIRLESVFRLAKTG